MYTLGVTLSITTSTQSLTFAVAGPTIAPTFTSTATTTPTNMPTPTPTATPGSVSVRSAWTTDSQGVAMSAFNPGDAIVYKGQIYNGTGSSQTISERWTATAGCGSLLDQSTNDTVGTGTSTGAITSTIPVEACSDTYTFTLAATYNNITTTQTAVFSVATATPTPTAVTVRSAWTADDTGATKATFDPGETVRYYGELYNGTGITQTVANQWQAWGACGWILNQATNESVSPATNLWYIPAPLPTGNCGGVYTYTLGVTYNSITSTQAVTFTVTGPTPTPTPTGVEQVAIDYSYDPLYRLTRASYTGGVAKSYTYSYDAVGNRLTQNANGALTTYSYDNANRLTGVNGQVYTWDNNGNLVSDGLLTYSYDQANRLKQATQGANTYTFAYNGVGDRLSQTVGVTTTHYVLDPAAGLTHVLADGTSTYLYGNGRLAQYQAAMQYFGADGLGSVRQLYDASGMVLANMRYDPYGSLMSQSGTATSVFGFTGEQYDSATGLTFLRARFYSAAQGRFTTRDVWAGDPNAPMSYNAWSYVYDNPANATDPSGQCTGVAPWTDFLGGALSSSGTGLSALPGYFQAAAAAGQKAGQNCVQNLAMASTRFQQGNYGSSFFYASGLNTALNESAAWLADHDANAGLGWWANWFRYQDRLENSRFIRMYYADRYTWWMRLRPEDLPDLLEDADAACQIGGTGLTIASFLVPAGAGVKAWLTRGAARSPTIWVADNNLQGKLAEPALRKALLGGKPRTLPWTFKTIDDFENGVAISQKSMNLGLKSYQDPKAIVSKLKGDINDLATFRGASMKGFTIQAADIQSRELHLAIPPGASAIQMQTLQGLQQWASGVGISVKIVVVP